MKKFEVTIQDKKNIKKMQRIVLILERLAGMLHEYKEIEITVSVAPKKKKWWRVW